MDSAEAVLASMDVIQPIQIQARLSMWECVQFVKQCFQNQF